MDAKETGARGEDAAAAYLERVGMTVVVRNWRCKSGEIDIVALDGTVLVIIEVKTRRTDANGTAEDAVSPAKRKRLLRLARAYVSIADIEPVELRFDVITIRPLSEDRALLRHHRAAFDAS